MEVRVWQSFSCNNSSSYYLVARFKSDAEATLVAGDIKKFLHTHAKQKETIEDWEAPSPVMGEIEKKWGFKFGKDPYIDWGGGGGMVGDEPIVGVSGDTAVFYHGYCGGLDFIDTMVSARGGKVVSQSDGDVTLAAMIDLADNSAGQKIAKQLATFFGQSAPNLEDWKAGPWKKKKAKYDRMPYAEVADDVRFWTDGKKLGFHMPFNADEFGELKDYLSGLGVDDHRLVLCDDALRDKLDKLAKLGACVECKSPALTLIEADASLKEDQLACENCGGMFSMSVMLAASPVQEICKGSLTCVKAVGESVIALNRIGTVHVKTPTAKKWKKTGKSKLQLHALYCIDNKNMLAGGPDGLRLTDDGGKTWKAKKVAFGRTFSFESLSDGTLFAGGGDGYGGGSSGGIVRSSNGGKKWELLKTPAKAIVFGISAASDDVLFACLGNGKVMRSKNGGKTWKSHPTPAKKALCRIAALSETAAVAVGDGGTVVTTTDGTKWVARKSGVAADIEDVIVGNDRRLYAVTSSGDLLVSKTGVKWERHSTGTRAHLWGVATTPSGTLVCVGDDGTVVRVEGLDSPLAPSEAEETEPLPTVGKTFVFTGKLRGMTRSDATTRANKLGGTTKSSVTKDLDYLVIGDEGSPLFGGGKKGAKMVKAEKLIADGAPLQIISETTFSRLSKLEEGGAVAKKSAAKPKAKAKPRAAAKPKAAAKKAKPKSKGKAGATVGRSFLFTGKLASMSRAEAKKWVTDLGGVTKSSVAADLDYLVIGDEGSPLFGGGKKGAKMLKAEKMIAAGASLRIMSETDFMKLKRK